MEVRAIPKSMDKLNTLSINVYDMDFQKTAMFKTLGELEGPLNAMWNYIWNINNNTSTNTPSEDIKVWESSVKMVESFGLEVKPLIDAIKSDKMGTTLLDMLKAKIQEVEKPANIISNQVHTLVFPAPNVVNDNFGHSYTFRYHNIQDQLIKATGAGAASLIPGIRDVYIAAAEKDFQIAKRRNYTMNQNVITAYEGTNLREFNFNIFIRPESADEIDQVFKAIMLLKQYSCAVEDTTTANAYLSMKGIFRFEFGSSKYNEILDHEDQFYYLTNITTKLGEEGYINKFKDGTPKQIVISLNFRSRLPEYFIPKENK